MKRIACLVILIVTLIVCAVPSIAAHTLQVSGNRIVLDKTRGVILYRDSGDLYGNGQVETIFSMSLPRSYENYKIIVAQRAGSGWRVLATEDNGGFFIKTDVTDVNGDGKDEIVVRGSSADDHGFSSIYALRGHKLIDLAPPRAQDRGFWRIKLRDLNGDGIPEVFSTSIVSAGFIGDHWLTIYKWNGKGYTDVSRRFSRQYDAVIKDLKRVMHDLQFTKAYGSVSTSEHDPELFFDLHSCLGKAYEYRGLPENAKREYAIAKKLKPSWR